MDDDMIKEIDEIIERHLQLDVNEPIMEKLMFYAKWVNYSLAMNGIRLKYDDNKPLE